MRALLIIPFLFGCAQLNELQNRSAEQVARAITEYCANTDEDFRESIRADVNAQAAPHSIEITCGESE